MFATDPGTAAAVWRPQQFGKRRANEIEDPIVEPLWTGPRVLALVDGHGVRMTDEDGVEATGLDAIERDLLEAAGDATLLLEAYLSPEPMQPQAALARLDEPEFPPAGQALSQMMFGRRSSRTKRLADDVEERRQRSIVSLEGAEDEVAFVAVDLLWLDSEPLLEVPLLERKRLLEAVLAESRRIRVGIHIRPPIDTWLGSWRLLGFRRLAFKAANSRYVPGTKNRDWALADIPAR